jgi:CubicO group peptidase (beta-lactamase class C family)
VEHVSDSADTTNSWDTVDAQSVSLDTGRLREMAEAVERDEYHAVNGVLLARSGKLAFERYFNGYDATSLMNTRSTTKTVTGMLIGIAIDRGFLAGVGVPVMTFFGDGPPGKIPTHGRVSAPSRTSSL